MNRASTFLLFLNFNDNNSGSEKLTEFYRLCFYMRYLKQNKNLMSGNANPRGRSQLPTA